jgi:hypothetical protein
MGSAPSCFSANNVQMVHIIPPCRDPTTVTDDPPTIVEADVATKNSVYCVDHLDLIISKRTEDLTVQFSTITDEEDVWSISTTPVDEEIEDQLNKSVSETNCCLIAYVGWEVNV